MKFDPKTYLITKTKDYLETNKLFILFNGANKNSRDWILTEQSLEKLNFNYYKLFNRTSKNIFKNSVYERIRAVINGVTFFFKPSSFHLKELTKQKILVNFESLLFIMLAIKLNNKIYSKEELKNIFSFNYVDNKQVLFNFATTNHRNLTKKAP